MSAPLPAGLPAAYGNVFIKMALKTISSASNFTQNWSLSLQMKEKLSPALTSN